MNAPVRSRMTRATIPAPGGSPSGSSAWSLSDRRGGPFLARPQRELTAFLILTRRTPGYPEAHGTLHAFLRRGGLDAVIRGWREGCEPGRVDPGRLPGPPRLLRHHRSVPRIRSGERGVRGAPRLARAGDA